MRETLLSILQKLKANDISISFDNQNAQLYRERAYLLKSIGLNSLAENDFSIAGFLEKDEIYKLADHSVISLSIAQYENQFQEEKESYYYQIVYELLINDEAFFKPKIDPLHFLLRSGNLAQLGMFNLSLKEVNNAIKYLKPYPKEYSLAIFNKSLLLLLVGECQIGWKLYEERWNTGYSSFRNPKKLPRPYWNGEKLSSNDTLLIVSEQGIGDNIQFIRYAMLLKQQGINVVVHNNKHISDFMQYNLLKYSISTTENTDEVEFTHWCYMMSLPNLCGTTLNNIPYRSGYLQSSPTYSIKWKGKLNLVLSSMNIGVVWRGGKNTDTDKIRSIDISTFSKLFAINTQFHILQKDVNDSELQYLSQYSNISDWHSDLHSFFDTAAIIEQMDLVISVDTSVAHLAAAMNKDTWILVNYRPDFRWLINRTDSPWYSSVRLFRQDMRYDWLPVIQNVRLKLENLIIDA